jgi:hypothetical protein
MTTSISTPEPSENQRSSPLLTPSDVCWLLGGLFALVVFATLPSRWTLRRRQPRAARVQTRANEFGEIDE